MIIIIRLQIRNLLTLVCLLCCGGMTSSAEPSSPPEDELRFSNGDRLTGTLLQETDTHFVFLNATLGEITVAKTTAKVVSPPLHIAPPVETLVGIAPINEDSPPPNKTNSSPKQVKKPDPSAVEKIANSVDAKTKESWSGKVEFGLRQQRGRRDLFTFDLRGSAERNIGDNEILTKGRLLYGEQDGRINNDRYDGSLQWRRELGKRTFAQSVTSYFQDDLKDIRRNWEQNFGAGYRLFEKEGHVVNLGAGLTGQYREATRAESGFYALGEVFQDYTYRINKRLTVRQNTQFQYSPDGGTRFLTIKDQPAATLKDATNYKVRFNSVLQGKLTQKVSLNLRFEFEYDNAVSAKSARTDQRVTSSLGYEF